MVRMADPRREERTPLLRGGGQAPGDQLPAAPASLLAEQVGGNENGSEPIVVAPLDEYSPPTYNPLQGGGPPLVSCRVCQHMIDISSKRDQHVVKCNNCNEATPIRNAPAGRKYVRCPCYCLLICKNTSQRIACPRPNCKRVISLVPLSPQPPAPNPMSGMSEMVRISCAHCHDNFLFNTTNPLARCPHCRKISSIGDGFSKRRAILFGILGLIFLVVAIGVTLGTLSIASRWGWMYLLDIALFGFACCLLLRGLYFSTMKISQMDLDPELAH